MQKVEINPKSRFGKPVIKGTRITVEEVLGALATGMDFDEIKHEYGITRAHITAAVTYAAGWMQGERTRNYEVPARR